MSDNPDTGPLSVRDAASAFGRMMEPKEANPEPVAEVNAEESEANAEDVGLEDTSEEFVSEDSSEDPEAGAEYENEAEPEVAAQTYTVRVDGILGRRTTRERRWH
jgi:hypothetical protein